jgi:hypothetical protein
MEHNKLIAEQFARLLKHSHAHASLENVLDGLPEKHRGIVPDGLPYSIWQLLDHIRVCLWDILEFCKSDKHVSPQWPGGYWSKSTEPASNKDWNDCIKQINKDIDEFIALMNNEHADLYKPFPWGDGQTLLKEAIVILDHNSYHVGQIVLVRRLLKDWKE